MLKMVQRWLRARMTLGVALAKHLLTLPWSRRRSNPVRWLGQMRQEALGPTPAGNWQVLAGSSKCIGCGLCDMFGDARLPRPSLMIQGSARLPSDALDVAEAALEQLARLAPDIARVCPTGVNTRDIVALISNNRGALSGPSAVVSNA